MKKQQKQFCFQVASMLTVVQDRILLLRLSHCALTASLARVCLFRTQLVEGALEIPAAKEKQITSEM